MARRFMRPGDGFGAAMYIPHVAKTNSEHDFGPPRLSGGNAR